MSTAIRFTITDDELGELLEAGKPVPYMVFGGAGPVSPQEKVNSVWRRLAPKYGVVWDSVRPFGTDQRDMVGDPIPKPLGKAINVLFDADPESPDCKFVDIEYDDGRGIKLGTWRAPTVNGGLWRLRITESDFAQAMRNEALA